jgi:hypothetical protein
MNKILSQRKYKYNTQDRNLSMENLEEYQENGNERNSFENQENISSLDTKNRNNKNLEKT